MAKIWWGFALLLGGCLWSAVMPANAAGKTILRCADVQTLDYPTVAGIRYLSRLVKERTGGRIEIIVYPGSKLGSEAAVVDMVKAGALEMGRVSTSQVAEVAPEFQVFVLPYLFNDNTHKWKVLNGAIGVEMLRGLRKSGLVGLCFQEAGYRSFYNSQHPIHQPDDLRGLKIRVQPSKIMIQFMEFLGAYPVPMNYDEVMQALQAKVLDGAENNPPSFFSSGHYREACYYSLDRHASIPEILIMSPKAWCGLKPADQQIIMAAARQSVVLQRRCFSEFETKCLEQLARAGCRMNEVDLGQFREKARLFNREHAKAYRSLMVRITKAGGQ